MESNYSSSDESGTDQQPAAATPQISKKQALKNWMQFDMAEDLAQSLVANQFLRPTDVQAQSLVYLNAHIDMVVAAKTGQGKTLCFGIPVLDLLCKRLMKEDKEFTTVKALVVSPTRELAIQINDHLQAVIPVEHEQKIKLCPIVGGMSIQKQERLLSYRPTIIVATPGRLWELLNERGNEYLTQELPLIDVLVLDEADRMIEDGHFKELKLILDFIYSKRVEYKKHALNKAKGVVEAKELTVEQQNKKQYKEDILNYTKKHGVKKEDFGLKSIEKKGVGKIDMSQIVDLYDEEGMLEEIDADNLVIDADREEADEEVKVE